MVLLIPTDTTHFEVEYEVNTKENMVSMRQITDEEKVNLMLDEKKDTIKFLANTFLIDENLLLDKLRENYVSLNYLDNSDNFDKIILDYLLNLETLDKSLFNYGRVQNIMNKDYIVKVLKYFSSLYPSVDFSIAAAIAQVESGFTSVYMLYKNNIFGGMYNGSLIGYKTIEYGVLKYVILLNDGYFNKGLITVDAIGKIYNPMFDENGIKVAKPLWVSNVTNALEEFLYIEDVDTNMLITLKSEAELLAN